MRSDNRSDRERFLARVRARLAGPEVPRLRPVEPPTGASPPIHYRAIDPDATASELLRVFAAAAEKAGSRVAEVHGGDVAPLLASVCDRHEVKSAVVTDEPECAGVLAALTALGVTVLPLTDRRVAATVDLGVTGAVASIALTGSIVLDRRRSLSRTASLLPRVHLGLVRSDAMVATPGDVLRNLPGRYPEGLPSNLTLETGPSRSADIEMQLTIGVHGPQALWIGVLGPPI